MIGLNVIDVMHAPGVGINMVQFPAKCVLQAILEPVKACKLALSVHQAAFSQSPAVSLVTSAAVVTKGSTLLLQAQHACVVPQAFTSRRLTSQTVSGANLVALLMPREARSAKDPLANFARLVTATHRSRQFHAYPARQGNTRMRMG